MQIVETPTRTFPVGGALSPYRRVRLNAGVLSYAGSANTDAVGTLDKETFANDTLGTVRLRTAQGTKRMVASEAITQWAAVYAAANGKIATSGTVLVGVACQAASGDNSIIEVLETPTAILGDVARTALVQEDLAAYDVDFTLMRVHDARQTNLPGTAANDDMGLITGTPGTDAPTLQGVDFGGTSTDEKCAFTFALPPEYVAGETVTLRVRSAMLTTVANGTATVDAEVFKRDHDGAVGADICATAAQSINSLTPANKDFTITPTGLAPGDVLEVRLAFAGSDSGDAGVMIPEISRVAFLLDIKG